MEKTWRWFGPKDPITLEMLRQIGVEGIVKSLHHVVNFSSMAAFRPLTRVMGYGAAKAGISNFTQFLANEVAAKLSPEIRVNAIAPGFFLTNQNLRLLTNEDGTLTERGTDVIRQTPFKRFGRPEELCGTIQYLISDASSFVTGTVAVVDGGFNAFVL